MFAEKREDPEEQVAWEVDTAIILKEPKTSRRIRRRRHQHGDHHRWSSNLVKKYVRPFFHNWMQFYLYSSSVRSSQNTHLSVLVDFLERWMHADLCHQWQRSAALWFVWSVLVPLLYSGTFSKKIKAVGYHPGPYRCFQWSLGSLRHRLVSFGFVWFCWVICGN